MDECPFVSVVVPTYRRPVLLERCLTALLNQDYDATRYEVIVVDDANDEFTREMVEGMARGEYAINQGGVSGQGVDTLDHERADTWQEERQRRSQQDALTTAVPVRYLPNRGYEHSPAIARNLGWRAAQGSIIAFTDDDTIPWSNWIKVGVNSMLTDDVAGVSGQVLVPLPEHPTDFELDTAGLEQAEFVTANAFVRRSALEAIHGFDERFHMAWREDSDLQFTLLEHGFTILHAPMAIVMHPARSAPWGVSIRQQQKSMYNALLFKKHRNLYRERVQKRPPLHYYAMVLTLAVAIGAVFADLLAISAIALVAWAFQVAFFAQRRLRHTRKDWKHVLEMVVTSAVIPLLSVFWRIWGGIRFGVFFL